MGLLQQALKLDPAYAIAHAGLAHAFEVRFTRGGFDPADLAAGVRHARAAPVHGGDDANALALAALIIVHPAQDYEAATDAISRAIALNGSCALAYSFGAMIHAYMNHPIAEEYASRALRLSPFDPDVFQCRGDFAALREPFRRSRRELRKGRAVQSAIQLAARLASGGARPLGTRR
jgi:adenylate cyclase